MTGGNDVTCNHAGLPGTTACEAAANTGRCWVPVPTAGATSTVGWLTAGKAAVAAGVNEIWTNCWSPAAVLVATATIRTHTLQTMHSPDLLTASRMACDRQTDEHRVTGYTALA